MSADWRPVPRSLAVLVAVAGLLWTGAAPAAGFENQARPQAVASWTMVPQSKDANGDGVIDGDGGVPKSGATSRQPSSVYVGAGNRIAQPHERLIGGSLSWYLSPRGFPVRLNACESRGTTARWTITAPGFATRTLPWKPLSKSCSRTVFLPEGQYTARLDVRSAGRTARESVPLNVRNILVVALGDSYASGEGNPRNVQAWIREGGGLDPYWDEDGCHRSARGAPALAALALEKSSARTSVTLVDVACSGATVNQGVLGAQPGAGQATSQVEQAAAIIGNNQPDLILLSVGGNDVGFTSILQTCALNADCPLATPSPGPLAGFPDVQTGVQARTAELAGSYQSIANCLGGGTCVLADGRTVPGLSVAEGGSVLPTLYPDITRAANGAPCSYLTVPAQDFAWAQSTILSPQPPASYAYPLTSGGTANLSVASGSLNQQVASSGRFAGWAPVAGTWSSWATSPEGHGVCAGSASWVFGFTGFTGFPSASFHPNPTGQRVLGTAIAAAAAGALQG